MIIFFISAYMKNNAANHHSHHIKQNNVCLFSEREWTACLCQIYCTFGFA